MRISRHRIDLEGGRVDNAVVNDSTLSGTTAATQADQEAASSTSVAVTPGRQHFHPGHPKCWCKVGNGDSTPAISVSYNITIITDGGTGLLTFTIATDFSGANWGALLATETENTTGTRPVSIQDGGQAAGTLAVASRGMTNVLVDPSAWHMAGFGDHA